MTRDAKKQSVKCEYFSQHDWAKTETEGLSFHSLEQVKCKKCGQFPKNQRELERADAILHLRNRLKPGQTVYSVLRHVSRSGMSRGIDFYIMEDGKPQWITASVGKAIDQPQSRKDWEQSRGLNVSGCGMDMGFAVVYDLSRTLFPKGFKVKGIGRNGDTSGWDNDGGYALKQSWL